MPTTTSTEEEMEAIRAALAPELYEQAEEAAEENVDDTKDEVYYNEGASLLFKAIENGEWSLALQYAEDDPKQVRLWVVSTGTVETTFNWSLWRRLPLHEACRRQAPAWLVSSLLSVYPQSAREPTQFGELPLHLAVECGAPPDVVNLLLIGHWVGIVTTDQSGRTPLEILSDCEMLDFDEHKVVMDSLGRGKTCIEELMGEHEEQLEQMEKAHASGLEAIHDQHSDDLALEQATQHKLLGEIERLKSLLAASTSTEKAKNAEIKNLLRQQDDQRSKTLSLQATIKKLETAKSKEQAKVKQLEHVIRNKDSAIEKAKQRNAVLETDLQMITAWHEEELQRNLDRAQRHARKMVESFSGLTTQLEEHGGGLRTLLRGRGIQLESNVAKKEEEKEPRDPNNEEGFVLDEDAVRAAAAAASTALKV